MVIEWEKMSPREVWEAKCAAPKFVVGPWVELADRSGWGRFDENLVPIALEFLYTDGATNAKATVIRIMRPKFAEASTREDADKMLQSVGYIVVDPVVRARVGGSAPR